MVWDRCGKGWFRIGGIGGDGSGEMGMVQDGWGRKVYDRQGYGMVWDRWGRFGICGDGRDRWGWSG